VLQKHSTLNLELVCVCVSHIVHIPTTVNTSSLVITHKPPGPLSPGYLSVCN